MKLEKNFRTKKDFYGLENNIHATVEYDPEQDSTSELTVKVWSDHAKVLVDITDIFEVYPFDEIIDRIAWSEIYREYVADALSEKEVANV